MNTVKESDKLLAKLRRQPRDRMSDGRSAWHELQRAAHGTSDLVGKKLPPAADRIARQLHDLLEQSRPALRAAGVSMTELARSAFGPRVADSKNIARLCLPPGVDSVKRGIRRNALQFRQLISAIALHTGSNDEQLADEVLAGTPLHPATRSTAGFNELDLLVSALSGIVNQLDREFDLFGTFRKTARLRQEALQAGSRLCWPQYDLEPASDERDLERSRQEWLRASDPNQFWWHEDELFGLATDAHWQPRGWGSGVLQSDEFFYVPHYPLGEVLLWDLPDPHADRAAYDLAVKVEVDRMRASLGFGLAPTDEFDAATLRPHGQTQARGANPCGPNFQYYFWLAIYPDPRNRRLIPVLYQPGEEGGAYLMPLDLETLAMLRYAVWLSPSGSMPVTQRLRQLISDPDAPILTAFRRTAAWLAHNPLVQWGEQRRRERDRLAAAVARLTQPEPLANGEAQ